MVRNPATAKLRQPKPLENNKSLEKSKKKRRKLAQGNPLVQGDMGGLEQADLTGGTGSPLIDQLEGKAYFPNVAATRNQMSVSPVAFRV